MRKGYPEPRGRGYEPRRSGRDIDLLAQDAPRNRFFPNDDEYYERDRQPYDDYGEYNEYSEYNDYDDYGGYDERYDERYDRRYDDRYDDRRYPPSRGGAPVRRRPAEPRQMTAPRKSHPLLIALLITVLLAVLAVGALCFIGYRTIDGLKADSVVFLNSDKLLSFSPFGKEKVKVTDYSAAVSAADSSQTDSSEVLFVTADKLININQLKLPMGKQFLLLLRTGVNSVWSLFTATEPYVRVEAGVTGIHPSLFLKKDAVGAYFTQEPDREMLTTPGCYELHVNGSRSANVMLIVTDTSAPYVSPTDALVWLGDEADGASLVGDINDFSPVFITYEGSLPNTSVPGEQDVSFRVSDIYGNKTEVYTSHLTVMEDVEAPVISGVKNQTIIIGDSIAYKKDISVTDNRDLPDEVTLTVDSSSVDTSKAGKYKVTYTATDRAGNQSVREATVSVISQAEFNNKTTLDTLVKKVADSIFKSGMTKTEKVRAIYNWVKHKIDYTGHSEKGDPIKGAINGFKNRSGDCYTYFSCAKALLDYCGIDNIDVEKLRKNKNESHHYWSLVNVGTGWYHLDCTPRSGGGFNGFMRTDKQLSAYSKNHKNSHRMESGKYPATPTKEFKE